MRSNECIWNWNKFFVNNLSHFIVQCCMRTQLHLNNSKSSFGSRTLANIWIAYEKPRISHTQKTDVTRLDFLVAFNFEKLHDSRSLTRFLKTTQKKKLLFPNTTQALTYTLMPLKHASRLKWNLKLKRHKMFANVFIYVCLEFHSQFRIAFFVCHFSTLFISNLR